MAAVNDGQGLVEGLHDVCGFVGGCLDPFAGLGALGFDALLLGLQDLFGYAALVVELDELLLLILEWERRLAVAPARRLEVAPLRVGWCVLLIFSD